MQTSFVAQLASLTSTDAVIYNKKDDELSPKERFIKRAEDYRDYYDPLKDTNVSDEQYATFLAKEHNRYINNLIEDYDDLAHVFEKVSDILYFIESTISDTRYEEKVRYHLPSVIFIIYLAKICGCTTAKEISEFYKKRNLELQMFLPNLPSPKYNISISTINNLIGMLSVEEMEAFTASLCISIDIVLEELISVGDKRERPCNVFLETVAFDGQEVIESFNRGSDNRKKKAAHILSIFNCTLNKVLSYTTMYGKNQERKAFLEALKHLTTVDGYLFMADALNSSAEVSQGILDVGSNYLLNIKSNAGNKQLKEFIEDCFKYDTNKTLGVQKLSTQHLEKNHGRIDIYQIEILPGSLITSDVKCIHNQVNTIVRYTKKSHKVYKNGKQSKTTTNIRYLISSLPFNEFTLNQIKYSILDYWSIEAHHGVLDNPRTMNQDATQSCRKNFISNVAGFNKCTFNFLTKKRLQIESSKQKNKRTTYKEVSDYYNSRPLHALLFDMLALYHPNNGEDEFLKSNHQSLSEDEKM